MYVPVSVGLKIPVTLVEKYAPEFGTVKIVCNPAVLVQFKAFVVLLKLSTAESVNDVLDKFTLKNDSKSEALPGYCEY